MRISRVSSAASKTAAIGLGTLFNLLLLFLPLFALGERGRVLLADPALWLFASLIAVFSLLEGSASFLVEEADLGPAVAVQLPYLSGVALLDIFWLSLIDARGLALGATVAGFAALLIGAGIAIRVLAVKTLGRYFVSHIALSREHRLITSGIYSVLRHPSELGLLLIGFGAPLLLGSLLGLLLFLFALFPLSLLRIYWEDRSMLSRFGERFVDYQSRTPALLPTLKGPGVDAE